jgi:hypothetical protein
MITSSDFLRLPFTPDLTEGGIAYAVRSLPFTFDRMGGASFNRLRRIVAGVAVELAFRRYLGQQHIPFDVKGATPFTDPDRYDVALGGHRCDIKSFLISHRSQIASLRSNPESLLKAPALVPSDQHAADGHREDDLYIFAFLAGLITSTRADMRRALEAEQPIHLTYPLPKVWSRPANWVPLAPIIFKSDSDRNLTVEINGQGEEREFLSRVIELPPHTRVTIEDGFFALSSIHVVQFPDARVGLHSPVISNGYIIDPFSWGNIWVYGLEIFLTGYISYDEFRRRAKSIPSGSHVFQYPKTKTKNLAVPVAELKPLPELIERVSKWEAAKHKRMMN